MNQEEYQQAQVWLNEKKEFSNQIETSKAQETKQEERKEYLENLRKTEYPVETGFSKPIKKDLVEMEKHIAKALGEREDIITFKTDESVPPLLYEALNGKSYLEKTLNLEFKDTETGFINNFILQKMRIGKLEDSQANYDRVLNNLLKRAMVSRYQQKDYLVKRVALYLRGRDLDPEDNLVNLIVGGRKNGRIR